MKVTLIGHYPPPYGGIGALMKQMEIALSLEGCRVTIFNLGPGRAVGDSVVNFRTGNRVLEFFQLARSFAFSDSDILHYISGSYRSFWLGSVCIVLARLTGHKIVISLVGGGFGDFVVGLGPIARRVAKFAVGLAHAVVACNSDIEEVLKRRFSRTDVWRLSNWFATLTEGASSIPENVENFVSSHSPVISLAGAMSPEYGLTDALEALAILVKEYPRIGLALALTSYGDVLYEKELLTTIESLRLEQHVLLERNIPYFMSLLSRSDAFLRSALVDGDSQSVRESLLLGVPTVASDAGFRPEGVILFRKGDSRDMAEKLSLAVKRARGPSISGVRKESEENTDRLLGIYSVVLGSELPVRPYVQPGSANRRPGA